MNVLRRPVETATQSRRSEIDEGDVKLRIDVGQRLVARLIAVSLLLVSLSVAAQQWMPPTDPDPSAIRKEADKDIEDGRLDLASQKYLWYHENALKYEPSLGGVRLSFALNDWRDLARQSPRALLDMQYVRDRAEESVRSNDDDFSAFQDVVALNDVLSEDGRTIELFKWLDQHDRHFARRAYVVAQDALVASGEFDLCGKYIVGDNSFESILDDYVQHVEWMEKRYEGNVDSRRLEFDQFFLARRTAYIIAILVNLDKPEEAAAIAEEVLLLLDSDKNEIQISDALEGIPPERLR